MARGTRLIHAIGWYGNGNLGDEAFRSAIGCLFPDLCFSFGNSLPRSLDALSGVWIGGGSVLDRPLCSLGVGDLPVAFIGVSGKNPHPLYVPLIEKAKFVVVRDEETAATNPKYRLLPDLVFGTPLPGIAPPRIPNKVVVLMNDFIVPRNNAPDWVGASYNWFVHEFAKVCNTFISQGCRLHFIPMGVGKHDDRHTPGPIFARIDKPENVYWETRAITEAQLRDEIATASLVITQRFHGIVFAVQAGTPFVAISHHDKLNTLVTAIDWPGVTDYYGFSYKRFNQAFAAVQKANPQILLDYSARARQQWVDSSDTLKRMFFGSPTTDQ